MFDSWHLAEDGWLFFLLPALSLCLSAVSETSDYSHASIWHGAHGSTEKTSGTTTPTCTSTWPSLIRRESDAWSAWKQEWMAFSFALQACPSTRLTDNDCVPWCLSASVFVLSQELEVKEAPCWGLLFFFFFFVNLMRIKPSFWVVSKKQIRTLWNAENQWDLLNW